MNNLSKILHTFLIVFSLAHHANADENSSPTNITEKFIENLTSGNVRTAVTSMYDRNNFLVTRATEIELLISQIETSLENFGDLSGYELSRIDKLTPVLERYIYQLYYDDFPIHVRIYTFKTNDGWVISSFNYNASTSIIMPIAHVNNDIDNEPVKVATDILDSVFTDNFEEMIRLGFKNTNERFITEAALSNIARQLNLIVSILGKPVNYHKLSHEKLSSKTARLIYFLNLENHPLPVIFDFYKKPNDDWALQTINFNDEFKNIEATIP